MPPVTHFTIARVLPESGQVVIYLEMDQEPERSCLVTLSIAQARALVQQLLDTLAELAK
jgi:hypothetical protein